MPQILLSQIPLIILVLISTVVTVREPRRIRCAIWWGITGNVALLSVRGATLHFWVQAPERVQVVAFLVAGAGILLAIFALGSLLILYGIRLIHRESFSVAHSLSLLLGVAILFYPALIVLAVVTERQTLLVYLLILGFPVSYLAFVLVSYLTYSGLYGFWAKRFAPSPNAVVVLGAGLDGDRLTPLLRARADLGAAVYERATARVGERPVMVASGGQGPGELIPEAVAIANYLRESGISPVLEEDRSTSTRENLTYTKRLLAGGAQPWMAVTSDYHAFRAAVLLQQLGIAGNAVGSKTPRYFWVSAVLREYVALLREHLKLNIVMMAISSLPLLMALLITVFQN